MVGGFDAAAELCRGHTYRERAWEFIRRFAAAWTEPLGPGDGASADTVWMAEQRLGGELPAALREAYLLFGRRPDPTNRQDPLLPPDKLDLDDSGTIVVFRVENQRCAEWGVAAADLGSADPPVYFRCDGRWQPFMDRVSMACVEMVVSEVLLGLGLGGQTQADLDSVRSAIPGPW